MVRKIKLIAKCRECGKVVEVGEKTGECLLCLDWKMAHKKIKNTGQKVDVRPCFICNELDQCIEDNTLCSKVIIKDDA